MKNFRKASAFVLTLCMIVSPSVTVFAAYGSFSKKTIPVTGGYQVFGKTTLSTSNSVSINQTYSKKNGTSTDATIRYVLTRTADGLAVGSEYLSRVSSGSVSPWYDNVAVKMLAYSDESSSATVSASWNY